ncbi:MAG: hydrolase 1, exosortase A system-associated [Sphingomonas sp.]|nr:hydrolase 1, exosortase A system-associated [Sphingomonas sp.]
MRRIIAFRCADETLIGSLDAAAGTTGVLIVSGGNEVRCGAHRGMAALAAALAAGGVPVFRFDRRGIGDSSGTNGGFESAADDIIAAVAAFRTCCPHLTRIVGFGNCDGASALALFGHDAGLDALVLANPWVVAPVDDLPPAAAIRARYATRLRDPGLWGKLVRGRISISAGIRGLSRIFGMHSDTEAPLEKGFFAGIVSIPSTVIIARGDATAQTFVAAAKRRRWRGAMHIIDTASHSFAGPGDAEALLAAVREGVR